MQAALPEEMMREMAVQSGWMAAVVAAQADRSNCMRRRLQLAQTLFLLMVAQAALTPTTGLVLEVQEVMEELAFITFLL